MVRATPEVVEAARAEVGDALRSVARYAEREYEFLFLRDDIEAQYSAAEIERVMDDLVISGIGASYVEQLFHAGRIQCIAHGFEQAVVVQFVEGPYEGVFVSFDRGSAVDFDAFIDRCRRALR